MHQKLFQTPPTALLSLLVSFYHVTVAPFFAAPISEVLLLNGPGTCFVLCIATYLNRVCAFMLLRTNKFLQSNYVFSC